MRACNCARASPFQSRTCEGCDPQLSIRQTMRISFNPCIRVGCDFRTRGEDGTSVPVSIHAPAWGATQALLRVLHLLLVSIHAPAWGATKCRDSHIHETKVSIHAPARGATSSHWHRAGCPSGFNPRTREGCDPFWGLRVVAGLSVSIHAPARGATCVDEAGNPVFDKVSIHAPARGATCGHAAHDAAYQSFNPRTREGCDLL